MALLARNPGSLRLFFRVQLRLILAVLILGTANHPHLVCRAYAEKVAESPRRPNIVFILADDK